MFCDCWNEIMANVTVLQIRFTIEIEFTYNAHIILWYIYNVNKRWIPNCYRNLKRSTSKTKLHFQQWNKFTQNVLSFRNLSNMPDMSSI